MKCSDCPYWQVSNKLRSPIAWGDCYRIVAILNPSILTCVNDSGYALRVPFDPHEEQYFKNSLSFNKEMNKAKQKKVNGVRVVDKKFFQTRGDFSCD